MSLHDPLKWLKSACAKIETPTVSGTGFLFAPDRLLTAQYVVNRCPPGLPINAHFGRNIVPTTVERETRDGAGAVLSLPTPLDARPVPLADRCRSGDRWLTYGFLNHSGGMVLVGEVLDPFGEDEAGNRSIVLHSSVTGVPLLGYGGAPVVVGDAVVGFVYELLSGGAVKDSGIVFAHPIDADVVTQTQDTILRIPTHASLRALLLKVFLLPDELDAFCFDEFADKYKLELAPNASRNDKITRLFQVVPPYEVLRQMRGRGLDARHEALLKYREEEPDHERA